MIEHYYLHTASLFRRYRRRVMQVMIRTIAAITHTAFVGRIDATINPAEKAIGVEQLLHLLMIITSVHSTPRSKKCYS